MTRGFYRVLIVIFIVFGPMMALIDVLAVPLAIPEKFQTYPVLVLTSLLGIVLQPVSAVGLWNGRRWGFWTLVVAAVLSLAAPGMALGPIFVLVAAPFRRDEAKMEHHGKVPPRQITELSGEKPDK
jgi:hypothetical protein